MAGSRQYSRHDRIKMHEDKSGEFYCCAFLQVIPALPRMVTDVGEFVYVTGVQNTPKVYHVCPSLPYGYVYLPSFLCTFVICLFCSKFLVANECFYMNLTSCILRDVL